MTICFSFICFRCCMICCVESLYLECASSVMSCSSLFSFVLSAFTRINYSSWNDITTIKQRRRRKDFIQGCSEVYMCTIGDFGQMWASNMFSHLTWGKITLPPFLHSSLKDKRNLWVLGLVIADILGYTWRKTVSVGAYLWTCFHLLDFWDGELFPSN